MGSDTDPAEPHAPPDGTGRRTGPGGRTGLPPSRASAHPDLRYRPARPDIKHTRAAC